MKAKILWNSKKKWAVKAAKEIEIYLKECGVKTVPKKSDFTVIVGGDGTILYHKEKLEGPVFAIGSEKSFICQCTLKNWKQALPQFLKNPAYEERMMLQIQVGKKKYSAVNDVVLISKSHQVLNISVTVGGDECTFDADGVVVSTPTGSTAYAYAAGGPVIEPTLEVLDIVPVAPDKRLFDPLVVSASHKIVLNPASPANLVLDGTNPLSLKKGEKATISKHKRKILFAVK